MSGWQSIDSAPKERDILVRGGELTDEVGSPGFGGTYLVYWLERDHPRIKRLALDDPGVWLIRAGFKEVAYVYGPTEWCEIPA